MMPKYKPEKIYTKRRNTVFKKDHLKCLTYTLAIRTGEGSLGLEGESRRLTESTSVVMFFVPDEFMVHDLACNTRIETVLRYWD